MKPHYPDIFELMGMAHRAGKIMHSAFLPNMKHEWKGDNTPVTEFDIAINQMVIDEIKRDYPHITVIGEEGSYEGTGSEYRIFVDPIDGTIPFCCGVPTSTFCISVLKDKKPISALIHDPHGNRMWCAEKGRGATFNGTLMHVSERTSLRQATVSIMWWNKSIGNLDKVCAELVDRDVKWMALGAIAIVGGLVASGDLSASIFPGQKAWETAAMQLLVEEAGGIATDLQGNKLVYDDSISICGHVMSNPFIHNDLLTMIARANKGW